jgi:nucleoside 2-deoxyribosyltransferase
MYSEAKNLSPGDLIKCPLCRSNCWRNEDPRLLAALYICPICGKFVLSTITDLFFNSLSGEQRSRIYRISFELRIISEKALGRRDNSDFPIYSPDDLQRMLDAPEPLVQDKLVLLLKYLGRITDFPGQVKDFDPSNDYSVVSAKNSAEAIFYFDSLIEQGFLERHTVVTPAYYFKVAASGWRELARIEQAGSESANAFIAMSFHPERDPFEKAISAAVRGAGYVPVRVDKIEHVNNIDDEIIARIRGSKFLISDFTLQSPGVYFEAGFMLGLGRPVIWLCQKKDHKNVHFDARQYNTIDYKDAEDLRTRLQFRIEAILGKGPHTEK